MLEFKFILESISRAENSIFLTEYRQQNQNSKFYIDSSYTQGYKNLNKKDNDGNTINRTGGSRNHFFLNFLGSYKDLLFSQNDLEVNIQRISQKNYLSVNQINTEHVKQDVTSLNSNVILNSYQGGERIKIETAVYENLNIEEKDLKYQYTFPSLDYKNYFSKFDQFININNLRSQQKCKLTRRSSRVPLQLAKTIHCR